jgi:hypothetical protein
MVFVPSAAVPVPEFGVSENYDSEVLDRMLLFSSVLTIGHRFTGHGHRFTGRGHVQFGCF